MAAPVPLALRLLALPPAPLAPLPELKNMPNLFQNPTKSIPKKPESFIVRTPMDQSEIGGRKDHLPASDKNEATISHIPNRS